MSIEFSGIIWYWRGPSPFYFVTVPVEQASSLKAVSGLVTYGWGMIPVEAKIGQTRWTTSLFAKDGSYVVPIRANVRRVENLDQGDEVTVWLEVRL
ncbi:MAG: DUF1905 domain-containing protein [Chloroflexota bacterium]